MSENEELVRGTEFTSVKDYEPRVKAKAYELFLTTELSLTDIAIDLGIGEKVVASWARQGGWRDRKAEIEVELFKSADDKYRRIIMENRAPTLERHLRVSKKLEEGIEKVIDAESERDVPNAMNLKRMAEALASATGVSARAAAISDKPFSDSGGAGGQAGGGKVPLIVIGVKPSVSPDAKGITIDVEADEA